MKLKDYKRVMGRLTVSDSLRERIIVGASVGRAPKPAVSHRPKLMKALSVAATVAVLAAVVTAFVLIVRFVGPQSPVDSGFVGSNFEADGFKLLSISTGCEHVSAEVVSYNPDQKSINVNWSFNEGYAGWFIEHEPEIFSQTRDGLWIMLSDRSNEEKVLAVASYRKISDTTAFGFAEYSPSTGHFLLEKSFLVKRINKAPVAEAYGTAYEVGETVGEYMLKIEFMLTAADDDPVPTPSETRPIAWGTDCDDIDINIYSTSELFFTRSIRVEWSNPKGLEVTSGSEYSIKKLIDGEWSTDWINTDVRFGNEEVRRTDKLWKEEYQLWHFSTDVTAGRYLVEKSFKVGASEHTMSVEFELADMSQYGNGVYIGYIDSGDPSVTVRANNARKDGDKLYLTVNNGLDTELLFERYFKLEKRVGDNWEECIAPGGVAGESKTVAPDSVEREIYIDLSLYSSEELFGRYRATQLYKAGDTEYELVVEFEKYSFDKSNIGLISPESIISDINITTNKNSKDDIEYEIVGYSKESGLLVLNIVTDRLAGATPSAIEGYMGDDNWSPYSLYLDPLEGIATYEGMYISVNIKGFVDQPGKYRLIWRVTNANGEEGKLFFEFTLGA